tara:strand:+ start:698 stop:814 length:117 start_codon:yes stop_codon:yes gene_type:complete
METWVLKFLMNQPPQAQGFYLRYVNNGKPLHNPQSMRE